MYRPKDWDKINPKPIGTSTACSFTREDMYKKGEACADAILEGLRGTGVFTYGHHTPDIDLDDAPEESGTWVFIPEEDMV